MPRAQARAGGDDMPQALPSALGRAMHAAEVSEDFAALVNAVIRAWGQQDMDAVVWGGQAIERELFRMKTQRLLTNPDVDARMEAFSLMTAGLMSGSKPAPELVEWRVPGDLGEARRHQVANARYVDLISALGLSPGDNLRHLEDLRDAVVKHAVEGSVFEGRAASAFGGDLGPESSVGDGGAAARGFVPCIVYLDKGSRGSQMSRGTLSYIIPDDAFASGPALGSLTQQAAAHCEVFEDASDNLPRERSLYLAAGTQALGTMIAARKFSLLLGLVERGLALFPPGRPAEGAAERPGAFLLELRLHMLRLACLEHLRAPWDTALPVAQRAFDIRAAARALVGQCQGRSVCDVTASNAVCLLAAWLARAGRFEEARGLAESIPASESTRGRRILLDIVKVVESRLGGSVGDDDLYHLSVDPNFSFCMSGGGRSYGMVVASIGNFVIACDGPECAKKARKKELKVCSMCNTTRYCTKECQVNHWKRGHKQECKEICQAKKDKSEERAREREDKKIVPVSLRGETLVIVEGLVSEQGRGLNGQVGIIVEYSKGDGRVGVQMCAVQGGVDSLRRGKVVRVKYEHLSSVHIAA